MLIIRGAVDANVQSPCVMSSPYYQRHTARLTLGGSWSVLEILSERHARHGFLLANE